jgi:hypothetical protein
MHRLLICPPDASSPALWRHVQWVYSSSACVLRSIKVTELYIVQLLRINHKWQILSNEMLLDIYPQKSRYLP